jgi:hypothetical protein
MADPFAVQAQGCAHDVHMGTCMKCGEVVDAAVAQVDAQAYGPVTCPSCTRANNPLHRWCTGCKASMNPALRPDLPRYKGLRDLVHQYLDAKQQRADLQPASSDQVTAELEAIVHVMQHPLIFGCHATGNTVAVAVAMVHNMQGCTTLNDRRRRVAELLLPACGRANAMPVDAAQKPLPYGQCASFPMKNQRAMLLPWVRKLMERLIPTGAKATQDHRELIKARFDAITPRAQRILEFGNFVRCKSQFTSMPQNRQYAAMSDVDFISLACQKGALQQQARLRIRAVRRNREYQEPPELRALLEQLRDENFLVPDFDADANSDSDESDSDSDANDDSDSDSDSDSDNDDDDDE